MIPDRRKSGVPRFIETVRQRMCSVRDVKWSSPRFPASLRGPGGEGAEVAGAQGHPAAAEAVAGGRARRQRQGPQAPAEGGGEGGGQWRPRGAAVRAGGQRALASARGVRPDSRWRYPPRSLGQRRQVRGGSSSIPLRRRVCKAGVSVFFFLCVSPGSSCPGPTPTSAPSSGRWTPTAAAHHPAPAAGSARGGGGGRSPHYGGEHASRPVAVHLGMHAVVAGRA